jgi:hypothetical protein
MTSQVSKAKRDAWLLAEHAKWHRKRFVDGSVCDTPRYLRGWCEPPPRVLGGMWS